MKIRLLKDCRGFTLLEVIVTVAITSIVMGAIVVFMDKIVHFKGTADTIQRFKKIEDAFEVLYRENIRYVEDYCYGWSDEDCRLLAILPVADKSDVSGRTLIVSTKSETVHDVFRNAGCTLVPGVLPVYQVSCADGYGFDYVFSISRGHIAGTVYMNGYNRTPCKVTITAGGNASMTDIWSSGYLDSEYMVRSQKKLLTLARAMKAYHLSRLTTEAISNPCGEQGGLSSNDDIFIPWIWQSTGGAPKARCEGKTNGSCGCGVFDENIWSTDDTRNIVNTRTTITNFLEGINVGKAYRTDGYGNPVTVGLITLSGGEPIIVSAPPPPSPEWSWKEIYPPYGGTVGVMSDGEWIYSKRVIYPQ